MDMTPSSSTVHCHCIVAVLPGELYVMWHQYPWPLGELACDAKNVVNEAIMNTSILTIVAFTIERWPLYSCLHILGGNL